jgi:hypothetical protein
MEANNFYLELSSKYLDARSIEVESCKNTCNISCIYLLGKYLRSPQVLVHSIEKDMSGI